MRVPLLLSGLLALTACHPPGTTPPPATATGLNPARPPHSLGQLPDLIAARLLLAREVAWAKFNSDAPVQDSAREASLLADLVAQGRALGLEAAPVETFFTAQLAASRQVQTELIAAWTAGAPRPADPPLDLRTQLRPRLDALTPLILDALPQNDHGVADATGKTLATAGFSPAAIALATAPLRP